MGLWRIFRDAGIVVLLIIACCILAIRLVGVVKWAGGLVGLWP